MVLLRSILQPSRLPCLVFSLPRHFRSHVVAFACAASLRWRVVFTFACGVDDCEPQPFVSLVSRPSFPVVVLFW